MDDSLITTLEQVLGDIPIGTDQHRGMANHLAGLHLAAGNPTRARQLAEGVLRVFADDAEALRLSAAAAELVGDHGRADELRDRQAQQLAWQYPELAEAPPAYQIVQAQDHPLEPEPQQPQVTLADVVGMDAVKQRLRRTFLASVENPELAAAFAQNLRGGMLLWGPPGVGKTHLARALAGEMKAGFLSASPADIYGPHFGESEQNVARLFAQARRESPCFVFLDELDALGGKRSGRSNETGRSVVNQLLTELDGMPDNSGVFVLGATNAPWDVDPALRRPGRFDRTILVLPPDEQARAQLLHQLLRGRPVDPRVDLGPIAARTTGFTGADLRMIITQAADVAMERSLDTGRVSPISSADLSAALRDTKPSSTWWFSQASNYIAFGGDGADYEGLRAYMRANRLG